MERRAIQLRVAGQTYKVLSTSDEDELRHLAALVDNRVGALVPKGKRCPGTRSCSLPSPWRTISRRKRSVRQSLERKMRDVLRRVLMRIDHALEVDIVEASEAE